MMRKKNTKLSLIFFFSKRHLRVHAMMRKENTKLSLIFFFSKRHLRVPLSVCKNLPANVFCCNHLHRTYINSLVKSNRFESNKHAFQAKWFDLSEGILVIPNSSELQILWPPWRDQDASD